ncbi:hypothetical protein FQN57_004585 [Myotisia sp. PD_48]|nr:hypothetical protein FQN57_004585 [Myotisia sp. PD_48]
MASLSNNYPWIQSPLITSAPMRGASYAALAVSVSSAGGIGFIGIGYDVEEALDSQLTQAASLIRDNHPDLQSHVSSTGILPVGIGFINWGVSLDAALPIIAKHVPAAVWLFGEPPAQMHQIYTSWIQKVHGATNGKTKVWVQLGSVRDALQFITPPTPTTKDEDETTKQPIRPDVIVVQGSDAGGHGLVRGASIITLLPEVYDELSRTGLANQIPLIAAGGIVDGRSVAAALCLGASGVTLGTRFLASHESSIAAGYKNEVIRASDGGQSTVRSTVYDRVRGVYGWPVEYDGRGVVNESFVDAEKGVAEELNRKLYELEMGKGDEGWGLKGRMCTYAGTGVGLVRSIDHAKDIVVQLRTEAASVLTALHGRLA